MGHEAPLVEGCLAVTLLRSRIFDAWTSADFSSDLGAGLSIAIAAASMAPSSSGGSSGDGDGGSGDEAGGGGPVW
jgi:uncharacterized membrane protein